jgi:hypothetical protein
VGSGYSRIAGTMDVKVHRLYSLHVASGKSLMGSLSLERESHEFAMIFIPLFEL